MDDRPILFTQIGSLELKLGEGAHATRRHFHDRATLNIVLTGQTQTTVGGRDRVVTAGEFVWIGARVAHLCEPVSKVGFRYAVIAGLERFAADFAVPSANVITGRCAPERLSHALNEFRRDPAPTCNNLKALLSSAIDRSRLQFLQANLVDLNEIAREVAEGNLNRYQRYRRALKELGCTQAEAIRAERIETAKRLLTEGFPASTVALECGFFDQSHFIRSFRDVVGTTPGRFLARSQRTFVQFPSGVHAHHGRRENT